MFAKSISPVPKIVLNLILSAFISKVINDDIVPIIYCINAVYEGFKFIAIKFPFELSKYYGYKPLFILCKSWLYKSSS